MKTSPGVHPRGTRRGDDGPRMSRAKPISSFATAATPTLAVLAGAAVLAAWPGLQTACFAQGSARLAALLAGSPVLRVESGWMLHVAQQAVVVTEACSATGFFLTAAALLAWHLARRGRSFAVAALFALGLALPATLAINALRVVAVAHLHRWVIPALPESWGAFAHMIAGVAVFLPALIVLNLLLESHAEHRTAS